MYLLEARQMLSMIAEIIRDLLIFVGVTAALLIALIIVASMMPNTNPLKRVLTALCYRLGATLAAGAVAIPLEPIPGIDMLYDIGVPIVLIWYWYTFFRDARRMTSDRSEASKLWWRPGDLKLTAIQIVTAAMGHGAHHQPAISVRGANRYSGLCILPSSQPMPNAINTAVMGCS
jgi:hypothetical protein